MFPVREHRKKSCWIWDRITTHNIWYLNWMPRPAAGSKGRSPGRGLNYSCSTCVLQLGTAAGDQQKTLFPVALG